MFPPLVIFFCLLIMTTQPCNATLSTPTPIPSHHNHTWQNPRGGYNNAKDGRFAYVSNKYEYFPGKPRWARPKPMTLTYTFSPENTITTLSLHDIRQVFTRAFSRWGAVIPVTFKEVDQYHPPADIKIGFYSGDHGDGEPFDGPLGILAHSFSPESGNLHLDAAETWAVDFQAQKSKVAVDLESVALHEIGHLLGLAHSLVEGAVMYPSLEPRSRKVVLGADDIEGAQALYGSNPNFTFGSSLKSDLSTSQAVDSTPITWSLRLIVFFVAFFFLLLLL